jgi:hypothetical protein
MKVNASDKRPVTSLTRNGEVVADLEGVDVDLRGRR